VTSWKPKDFNLVSATKACNVHKNRNMDIIPIENARVHLTPKPGVDGSDYINATWVSGKYIMSFFILKHSLISSLHMTMKCGIFRLSTQPRVYHNAASDGEHHNGVLANDVGPQCTDYRHVNSMR